MNGVLASRYEKGNRRSNNNTKNPWTIIYEYPSPIEGNDNDDDEDDDLYSVIGMHGAFQRTINL